MGNVFVLLRRGSGDAGTRNSGSRNSRCGGAPSRPSRLGGGTAEERERGERGDKERPRRRHEDLGSRAAATRTLTPGSLVSAASAAPLRFYIGILFHVQIDLNCTSRSISILRPNRPQSYVQFDLNFTSDSTSILRPIRPQFYVQFDLNFTFNSTSILRPIRPQFYKLVLHIGVRQRQGRLSNFDSSTIT